MLSFYDTPITANFIVTRNCNGNCIFCGVKHKSSQFYKEKDIDKIKEIIDKLYDANLLRINFFGGEPTIYPYILDAVKYAKSKEFFTTLITNGIYFPQNFEELKNSLDGIAISIHGIKESHCNLSRINLKKYEQILSNIEKINDLNIPLTINMTVTSQNYQDIPNFIKTMLSKYKIDAFAFNRYIPNPNLSELINNSLIMSINQLNESLELIDKVASKYKLCNFKYAIHFPLCIVNKSKYLKYVGNCGFGQNYISIDCDGNIQACSYTNEILGNVFKNNLKDIWNKNEDLNKYRNLTWLPKKCIDCKLLLRCLGGCKETRNLPFSYDIILDEVGDYNK